MRISRIYYEGPLKEKEIKNLPLESSHYIMHVLRLKIGSKVILFNGNGMEYQANIIDLKKKTVSLEIIESKEKSIESPLQITLVQAVCRSEKFDWVVQKAVELGVQRIIPLITQYCSLKLNEEQRQKRIRHWGKIIIGACEQSGRAILPTLDPIEYFNDWLLPNHETIRLFCDPISSRPLSSLPKSNAVTVLIGPEGGLSTEEIQKLKNNQFIDITLGPRILRTETAAIAALTVLQNRWGDL